MDSVVPAAPALAAAGTQDRSTTVPSRAAAPAASTSRVDPVFDTPAIAGGILDDLRRSQGTVLTEMYGWRDSGTGRQLADELRRIAGEGRPVSSIIDYNGARMYPGMEGRKFLASLRDAGVDAIVHGPLQVPGRGRGLLTGSDHRKVFIIQAGDTPVAWLGGKNFGASFDPWHDVMVRVQGPAVGELTSLHMERLRQLGREPGEDLLQLHRLATSSAGAAAEDAATGVQILANDPGTKHFGLTDHVVAEMRRAQRTLWVESPLNTSPEMVDELVAAARRGAAGEGPRDVRLLLPAKVSATTGAPNGPGIWYELGKSHYKRLIEAGVQVLEQPEMSHQKVLRADDRWTVSSFNLAHRSVAKDFEIGAAFTDATAGAIMERKVLGNISRSHVVTLAEAEGGRAMQAFRRVNQVLRLRV